MKGFLKIFLIVFMFLISMCNANASLYMSESSLIDNITVPNAVVYVNNNEQENSIVAANSNGLELSALKDNKETYSGGNIFKSSAQYKFLQEIFSKNYNKVYLSTSHKISPYLKNEICTRAP